MKAQVIEVTFQPSGRKVFVLPGTMILEAAARAGIILQTPCGGRGTCGNCKVKIISGSCKSKSEIESIPQDMVAQGYRPACQTSIDEPVVLEIPEESMFESRQQILVGDSGEQSNLNPAICKTYFELDPPSSKDTRSDLTRLLGAIGDVNISSDFMRMLSGFLRSHEWRGTAVLAGRKLIALESGDTSKAAFGVAFDIGTTTVVGTIFNLSSGRELGVASEINSQVAYGDDVISRILRVREDRGALSRLQESIMETVNSIIAELTQRASIHNNHIYEIVIAGNSTMQQIFCGFDPSALGEMPFVQVFDDAQTISASKLGIKANPGAEVFVFPQIGGFVGGDTVAGMVAARLDKWEKPVLFVDIGTNGEIVLANHGRLLATSTAAGPAFEGARITQGMRATAGAIEKVIINEDVLLNVIGNVRPAGICGTALIDAAADLLRKEIVDSTGRILTADDVPSHVSMKLRERLITKNGKTNFVLAMAEETASGEPVYLWQKDIRELQLATGAIRAGINILLRRSDLRPEDLGGVLLAGAFGNFIRRSNACRIGLLPQVPHDCIRFIGNAASLGAKLALLSVDERKYANDLRKKAEHIDLSLDPEFQTEFSMGMMFPESDMEMA